LGNLPEDFLRPDSIASSQMSQQEMADHQLALHLQQQQWASSSRQPIYSTQHYAGQLIITVVEVRSPFILFHV
jgi:hypothetical protein